MLGLLIVGSCKKPINSSPIPVISYLDYVKYQNIQGKDSLVVIRFHFEDGDGDLGYTDADTVPPFDISSPYFYNLHTDFYEMDNGVKKYYVDSFSGDTIRYDQRLVSLTPEGKYKGISGTMELRVDFTILLLNGYAPKNFEMDLWINDRKLNISNTISTPVIQINP